MAWYDCSAIDPRFASEPPQAIVRNEAAFVNDARMIDWPRSDVDLAERLRRGVEQRLEALERDTTFDRAIVVTHVPVFEAQMSRKPGDERLGRSNTYFGHLTLGEVIRRFAKVTDVVSGHTHWERDGRVERPDMSPIRTRVLGSVYGTPAWVLVE